MAPTTRRYPRTLQEAFPRSYPDWISHFKPRHHRTTGAIFFVAGMCVGVLLAWRM